MLINTYLDTEDFVHLYYPEDEPPAQGCGAGARLASKYPPRPPSPTYTQAPASTSEMSERERHRTPPQPEPPPHCVRAADLYPRLRTHYDEPGLDVGFSPICGEFVQWVGVLDDGSSIAMSNYRLHIQPRRRQAPGTSVPLRLIEGVEIRDLLNLTVLCKHGRQLRYTFKNGEHCVEWWRRISSVVVPIGSLQETFGAAYAAWAKEQPPSSVHRELMRSSQSPQRHWFGPEVERLGFTTRGAWRVSAANAEYRLCTSYPPLLIVPATVGDEDLDQVARFRAMRRVPAVVWRHRGNGAVIARSSQPEVGWLGWRSTEDERLLAAFVSACNMDPGLQATPNKNMKLLIVDARSYTSAVTNRARGGGCECQQYYPAADIQFMCLPNIHNVRRSFQQLRALAAEPSDQTNWHSNLERTLWLQYLSGLARAASVVVRAVVSGRPVLVHCSDGWDRTPQIVATAQLMLDPYYRTLEGFRVLIEREWLDFGHKFADRCGHQFGTDDPNERSPIFLQWLDLVHQMLLQYPCSFEFNEAYLIKLAMHVHSCMFGTFLFNTSRERIEARINETTAHVWQLLRGPAYRNHLYPPHYTEQVLFPEYSVRVLQLWRAMFCGERADHEPPEPPVADPSHQAPKGVMTKTRSCDNLLKDSETNERRTTQRRCSDPNLAPDVMKLSNMVATEEYSPRKAYRTLTDSCVDELPALHDRTHSHHQHDQVDGMHPDHFENGARLLRDIASGSSSLERELALTHGPSPDIPDNVSDKTENIITESVIDHLSKNLNGNAVLNGQMDESVVRVETSPEVDTPDEPAVFVCDAYGDVIGIAEAARESGRTRNISITWRSVSESSNQSSAFETSDTPPQNRTDELPASDRSHESSPLDNHNSTEGDVVNHNVVSGSQVNNHSSIVGNGVVNGIEEVTSKFLEVNLNGGGGAEASSSSVSSESDAEGEAARARRAHPRPRVASQLTLCPASPRRLACCHCTRRGSATSGIETSCESGASSEVCWCGVCGEELGTSRIRCTCGGSPAGIASGAGGLSASDALDGLPPAADPLQSRLHQIILHQKKVVEDLSSKLKEAHDALKRVSSPAAANAPPGPPPDAAQGPGSGSGSVRSGSATSARSGSARSGSSSSSASEIEVGEEARSVVWLPDSAAVRCQYCRNHFWLARRRHHCRRCGGIFCGSCAVVSAWGDFAAMRVCRRCRALR